MVVAVVASRRGGIWWQYLEILLLYETPPERDGSGRPERCSCEEKNRCSCEDKKRCSCENMTRCSCEWKVFDDGEKNNRCERGNGEYS